MIRGTPRGDRLHRFLTLCLTLLLTLSYRRTYVAARPAEVFVLGNNRDQAAEDSRFEGSSLTVASGG